ncbi:MAG: DUF5908 family protein [Pseudomonadota bacterium]|nr:DUF5908 family protein [Pseudomonadota bacterium]
MSIEIKQLVIKSTIAEDSDTDDVRENLSTETLKNEVLGECRRLVMELLDEKGLR